MPPFTVTDLTPIPCDTGAGPSLPWPGFPQLPGFGSTPGFCGTEVPGPLWPGCTPTPTPGPAESPIVF
jgi:hypothetical protein